MDEKKLPYAMNEDVVQRVSEQLMDDAAAKETSYEEEVESFIASFKIHLRIRQ